MACVKNLILSPHFDFKLGKQFSLIMDLNYDSYAFTSILFTRWIVFTKFWHKLSLDSSNLCAAKSNVYESFWWHFKLGLVLGSSVWKCQVSQHGWDSTDLKPSFKWPDMPLAKLFNCIVMGNPYVPIMGKAHLMKIMFTSVVLVRQSKFVAQLGQLLLQESCMPSCPI